MLGKVTLLVMILGYGGAVVLLLLIKLRSRQERAPFPENKRLLRGPGESLRRRLVELEQRMDTEIVVGLCVALVVFALILWVARLLPEGWLAGGVVVAFAGYLAMVWLMATRIARAAGRSRNTRLGYFGERLVAEELEPLKAMGCRVFHDVPGADGSAAFNIDHVVVAPTGVFAIETKTRRKGRARVGFMEHEIIYDGRALSYPWGEDRYGLDQARRQADWLAGLLGELVAEPIPVRPLLVFPGWFVIRKGSGPVTVLNPREIASAVTGGPVVLTPERMELIARQLAARCRDVEL